MKRLIFALALLGATLSLHASDVWTVEADTMSGNYYGVSVANGGIGIVPWNTSFSIRRVHLNGIYDTAGENGVSRAVKGINPFLISMSVDSEKVESGTVSDMKQVLDMRHAVHRTSFTVPGKVEVTYEVRALRHLMYAGMVVVEIKALGNVSVELSSLMEIPNEYVDGIEVRKDTEVEGKTSLFLKSMARTRYRGKQVCASSAFITDSDNSTQVSATLKKGEVFKTALVGAVVSSDDFIDPYNEADREVIMVRHQGIEATIRQHEALWDELWKGDIEIEGDDDAQMIARLSLYHLYSFCREGSRLSIPPFGLSAQGYNGHIFWDTETWMYPPMLFLNGGIARSMMDYRADRLPAARKRASTYGYKGAMFPWESDALGEEACPTFALTGLLEQHITADIAIAAWNYYRITGDVDWLREYGWPLLREGAEFWMSRVRDNGDGTFSIPDVVGADEYACGVDDNAFTNGAVKVALDAAVSAAKILGYSAPSDWSVTAKGIKILKMKSGVTAEYDGYDGQTIKQADVNLLAYPLQVVSDRAQIAKDLKYYEKKMDPNGPAMSFAILALLHSRIGDGAKAYELFYKAYSPNRLPPFGVVSECAGGTNPFFSTGAGGILQTLINGFCGLELTDDGVVQLPSSLPPHWTSITVKGVGPERETFIRTGKK